MKKLSLTLLATTVIIGLLIGCANTVNRDIANLHVIKFGAVGPLTGDYSWLGQGNANGALIALEEESDENWKFELVIEDGQCDTKQAVNAYNRLKLANVTAIIGGACSSETLAMAPLTEGDQIVLMSASATNPDIADAGDYVFRVIASDAFAGKVAAGYMYNDLGLKKVGVNAKNDAWGQGLSQVFATRFQELGGEITTLEKHEQNAVDMRTQLTKIKNSGAQAIYGPTFSPETVVMVKQMQELGMSDWLLVGGDGTDKSAAEALKDSDVRVVIVGSKKNNDKYGQEFNEKYETKFNKPPELFSAEGYDAGKLLAIGAKTVGDKETGEVNSEALKNYLYKVSGFAGASGRVTIDERGESVEKKLALFELTNGTMQEFAVK